MKVTASVVAGGPLPVARARILHAAWRLARRHAGCFVLLVDNTSPSRPGRPEDDLAWLGLDWDERIAVADHADRVAAAAEQLVANGRLYPCFENADELRAKADRQRRRGQPVRYDRAMLRLTAAQRSAAEAGGKRPHWRFRLSDHVESWQDAVIGRMEVALPTLSDPVLRAADGSIDRLLATAATLHALGATHRVAGQEDAADSAVLRDLAAALGGDADALALAHLPVLPEAGGRRVQGLALRALRQDGVVPAALRRWFSGLGDADGPPPPGARADIADLLAANRAELATLPFASAAGFLPPAADAAFWERVRGEIDLITEARALLPRPEDG